MISPSPKALCRCIPSKSRRRRSLEECNCARLSEIGIEGGECMRPLQW